MRKKTINKTEKTTNANGVSLTTRLGDCHIKYMHTIDAHAADYHEGKQICYASKYRPIKLANDLKQIKAEQRATKRWRTKQGFQTNLFNYSWIRVAVA
jgi:hypothetical protein